MLVSLVDGKEFRGGAKLHRFSFEKEVGDRYRGTDF